MDKLKLEIINKVLMLTSNKEILGYMMEIIIRAISERILVLCIILCKLCVQLAMEIFIYTIQMKE